LKTGFFHELRKNRVVYAMMIPALAYFVMFCYVPMAGAYMAFVEFNGRDGVFGSPFVGLKNFKFLVTGGEQVFNAVLNTLYLNAMFILCGLVAQIGTALFINEIDGKHFKKASQSLMFLPYFLSWVVIGAIVYCLLANRGFVNTMLTGLGLQTVKWYASPQYWKTIMILVNVWKFAGYGSVIYLAAIAGMDMAIFEAARVDGVNKIGQIRYMTLPLLKPTVVILTLMSVGRIFFGDFGMTIGIVRDNGLLIPAVEVIDSYVYHAMLTSKDFSFSTAVGLCQSVLGLGLILGVNHLAKRINDGEGLF
jgi:multiple sugar transport system permease protein/putative aldouronate transport system permease protein